MTANPNSETWDEDGPDSQEIATMTALFSEGRLTELETLFRTWTVRFPKYVPGWQALATMLKQQGRNAEVLAPTQKIAELLPDDAEAHFRLGNALLEFGQADGAVASYRRALEIKPDFAEAHSNLGSALHELGRLNEAEASCRQALQINPDYAEAHSNLGAALNDLGRLAEAETSFRRALQIKPDFAEALNNRSNTFKDLGRLTEAEACCRRALEIKPDYAEAHHNMGNILKDLSRLDEAETSYRRALEIKPDSEDTFSNLLFVLNYHPDKSGEEIFEVYREYDAKFGLPHRSEWRPHDNSRETQRRLKVGYVSPDFYKHSVRHFLEPLLAHHDKNALEIYAYAELTTEDQFTARYKSYVDHWVSTIGIDDATLAERIRADGIDILADLAGHTSRNRLGVFARKPAPVSLSWLGYGYSTGLSAIDYLLTDEASVPADSEGLFSETPWRLATPGYVYRPGENMGEINPLPAMSAGYVTFGTLSRGIRINHRVIGVWSEILKRVEDARLVIDSGSFLEAYTQDSLAEKFAAHGISRDRLQIGCHSPPWDVLRGLDIGLDCFPHNSGTTLFESLYMGVPYITLAGRPSVGRIGSSILEGAGHPEWIAKTEDEYVEKAVALAGDLAKLAALRAGLRQEMQSGPLMDEPAFARKVEAAYREMFEQWAAGMNQATDAGTTDETLTVEQALHQASAHHEAGRLQDAEQLYRAILQVQPNHPEANYKLGILAVQTKQPAAGLPHFMTALEAAPTDRQYWLSYIDALIQADMLDAARQVLALGQQLGVLGDEIEALEARLENDAQVAEHQPAGNESRLHTENGPSPQETAAMNALFAEGRLTELETLFRSWTVRFPEYVLGWQALGSILQQQERGAAMLAPIHKALAELQPENAEAHFCLGNTLLELGQLDGAVASYRRALDIEPDFAEVHSNLGNALKALGRPDEAMFSYRRALEIKPDFAEVHSNLGNSFRELGYLNEAVDSCRRALEINPNLAEAHCNLAGALHELGLLDEAELSYRRALEIKPDYVEAHSNLGITLNVLGRLADAEASHRRAMELKKNHFTYAGLFHLLLPVILETTEAATTWRKRYEAGISALSSGDFDEELVNLSPFSFYLAYHNQSDKPLLEALGHMFRRRVTRLSATAPHVAGWLAPTALKRRIRVGFLSEFLANHTIGRLFQGFIRHLDRRQFEVIIIHAPKTKRDAFRQSIDALADKALTLPAGLKEQQASVMAECLDILFYPDIGMSSVSYFLAYARLAPVQAVSWGHPDTSGLDSIDYFVSAASIEPPDADEHYSERLIRLNRMPCYYQPPVMPNKIPDRRALGLPETGTLYGCPQSLFKFHPDFDTVLASIAEGDPNGHIVLIGAGIPSWTSLLKTRWAINHPVLLERAIFLPAMPHDRFMALMAHIDIQLDPIYFGSGNTMYEAMMYGTPIVTYAGKFMRGRIVAGCYKQMGIKNPPIAEHLEDYAQIALALARNPEYRRQLKEDLLVAAGKELFLDIRAVKEFECFLFAAVDAAQRREKLPIGWRPSGEDGISTHNLTVTT